MSGVAALEIWVPKCCKDGKTFGESVHRPRYLRPSDLLHLVLYKVVECSGTCVYRRCTKGRLGVNTQHLGPSKDGDHVYDLLPPSTHLRSREAAAAPANTINQAQQQHGCEGTTAVVDFHGRRGQRCFCRLPVSLPAATMVTPAATASTSDHRHRVRRSTRQPTRLQKTRKPSQRRPQLRRLKLLPLCCSLPHPRKRNMTPPTLPP